MKVLDLFSGIGGFSLGLERAGMTTAAFCEYDEKARQVLSKHWPDVPQYNDVRTLTKEQLDNDGITDIGLICGGYPCQPFSTAGQRKGQADDRHLWPEYFRLVKEIRPDWVLAENVAGHITMGLDDVLADLEGEGYSVQAFVIPACAVGAQHRRDRVWIVGNSNDTHVQRGRLSGGIQEEFAELNSRSNDGNASMSLADPAIMQRDGGDLYGINDQRQASWQPRGSGCKRGSGGGKNVADSSGVRQQGPGASGNTLDPEKGGEGEATKFVHGSQPGKWLPEPPVGRVAHGVPGRVDRLKQLGNAVVPQVVEMIGQAIMAADQEINDV